jgi:hypothetical protein
MSKCECGNAATENLDGRDLCEWCAPHIDCTKPETVYSYLAHLSGEALWRCTKCSRTFLALDCVCETEHDCEEEA